ncbi:integrase core domain-containing protein, partial [Peptoniphilus sp.]
GYTKNYNEEQYRKVVEYWIYYYNNERIHSSIGYITPIEYLIEKNMRH